MNNYNRISNHGLSEIHLPATNTGKWTYGMNTIENIILSAEIDSIKIKRSLANEDSNPNFVTHEVIVNNGSNQWNYYNQEPIKANFVSENNYSANKDLDTVPIDTPKNGQVYPANEILQNTNNSISQEHILSVYLYLQAIFSTISVKKLILSHKLPSLLSKISKIISKCADYPNLILLFQELLKKLQCSSCQLYIPIISFECSHSLCENCFNYVLKPKLYNTIEPLPCPSCFSPLKNSEFQYVFPEWKERQSKYQKYESIQTAKELECNTCHRVLLSHFFRCCKTVCLECQLDTKTLGFCECQNFFVVQLYCDVCRSFVGINDAFAIFCNGHLHCENCIKKCAGEFKCLACLSVLETIDIKKVLNYAYKKCVFCYNSYEACYFFSEKCCRALVCVLCQCQKSFTNCIGCNSVFSLNLRIFLERNEIMI